LFLRQAGTFGGDAVALLGELGGRAQPLLEGCDTCFCRAAGVGSGCGSVPVDSLQRRDPGKAELDWLVIIIKACRPLADGGAGVSELLLGLPGTVGVTVFSYCGKLDDFTMAGIWKNAENLLFRFPLIIVTLCI